MANLIGARVERKEDKKFLTGKGRYTADINLTHQTYAYFVRSPHARAKEMSPYFLDGLFSLKDLEVVDNIRGYGMMGGIDIKLKEKPGRAGFECFKACYEIGVNFKATGDCLIIAPAFVCEKKHIDEIFEKLRTGISNYMKK